MTPEFDSIIRVPSPIGRIEVTGLNDRLTSLAIAVRGRLPHDGVEDTSSATLVSAARQLAEYFSGARQRFEVPMALHGSAFQTHVWNRLANLPWGQTISYGALAADIGKPGSGRAVGGAVAANPLPIIIGTHRVLSSTGRVTGYTGGRGVQTKLWLLRHEKVLLAA